VYGPPFDPAAIAADVDQKRRSNRVWEARDALHAALPYAPHDASLCLAGGRLYHQLGYAREAMRFLQVVEQSGLAGLVTEAAQLIDRIAAEGTEGSRDRAVCVLSLMEVYRFLLTPYARQWPYAHWESACLRDPCWSLTPQHLAGALSGGHATPPGHRRAWWTVRYAIEALSPAEAAASLGKRFAEGEVLVYLETPAGGLPFAEPSSADRLGTLAPVAAKAMERVTEPIDVARVDRVYVAGRIEPLGPAF
jgi:hypothetical protein